MDTYVINTKMIVKAHEIGPDLADYLEMKGHKMCPRCSRPTHDIVNPFKDRVSEYGDFGISKLLGCKGDCSGEPTKWRFGDYSRGDITIKRSVPRKGRGKTVCPKIQPDNYTVSSSSIVCAVGPNSTSVGRALKIGQYVKEEKSPCRVKMTVYNSDGTVAETYIAVGKGAKVKIPGYNC